MREFAMSLPDKGPYSDEIMRALAKERGVSIQEFLRNVVIPEWLDRKKGGHST